MPLRTVLDSTILVSAFLTPGGAADAVLQAAMDERCTCILADPIFDETTRRLLDARLQRRYAYTASDVAAYEALLRSAFTRVTDLPFLTGIVRDPNDDMILACAVAASATYVVTRDHDLLSLVSYEGITVITPEAFLALLRSHI
jgi:putative PIN family toxin of toxin-antitoxin system